MPAKKRDNPSRLGLMGGSFNPIHYGHLTAAEEALSRYDLDHIIFIPCGNPPHKQASDLAPAEDRYLMTVIAVAPNPLFSVSRYEVDKAGESYTVETMEHFKEMNPEAEIFFITGADSVLDLETWQEPERIFKLGNLIAATRPGYTVDKAPAVAKDVLWMEIPAIGVSATEIRRRIREKRPVTYLLPRGVQDYIISRGLYQG